MLLLNTLWRHKNRTLLPVTMVFSLTHTTLKRMLLYNSNQTTSTTSHNFPCVIIMSPLSLCRKNIISELSARGLSVKYRRFKLLTQAQLYKKVEITWIHTATSPSAICFGTSAKSESRGIRYCWCLFTATVGNYPRTVQFSEKRR